MRAKAKWKTLRGLRELAVLAFVCAATSQARADWTLRCSQFTIDSQHQWVKLRENGNAITQDTDAGPGVPAYAAPSVESVGSVSACGLRLRTPSSLTDPFRVYLIAHSRMNARNVRVRATMNAFPSVAPQGQYVIAVRSRGSDLNKHGIFVRVNYASGTMQIARKSSTNLALAETVLASTNVNINSGLSNRIEVIAAKDTITARLYASDGNTLISTLVATDGTAGFRSGDVFVGGEVVYGSGNTAASNIDLTWSDVSVVDLARSTRLTLANQPSICWTLPSNNTQGRFIFSNVTTTSSLPQQPRRNWVPMEPTSGPSLNSFRARAMADFDQDGGGDVLYHNLGSGLVRRVAFDVRAAIATPQSPRRITSTMLTIPQGWTLAAAADFTGDGDADVLWQNNSNNTLGLVTMRRVVSNGWLGLPYVPPPYKVVGTADFDLDGNFDLLWQDSTSGAVYIGRMNRTSYVSFPYLGVADPIQWRVLGTLDYNADDVTDVLWQNTSTGQLGVWLLNETGTAVQRWESFTVLSNVEWRGGN